MNACTTDDVAAALTRAQESEAALRKEVAERRRVEAALHESEDRYRRMVHAAEVGIWEIDSRARTSFVNPKMAALLGYTVEEMTGRPLADFMDAEGRAITARNIERRQQGIAEEHAFKFLRKDGSSLWTSLSTSPLTDSQGQYAGALAMAIDITDRKAAEGRESAHSRTMTLMATGAPLSAVLDSIVRGVESQHPGMLCSVLLLDREGARLVTGAAPSLPEFYSNAINGIAIGPGVGSCGTAAYLGERVIVEDIQSDALWASYKELAARAGLASCWSEPIKGTSGKVLGTFAIYHGRAQSPRERDIETIEEAAKLAAVTIERNRAEEALLEQKEFLDAIVQNEPECVKIVSEDGSLVQMNQAGLAMLEVDSLREAQECGLIHFVHPDYRDRFREFLRGVCSGKPGLSRLLTFLVRGKRGTLRWLETRATPLPDRRTGATSLLGVTRDVTDRVRAESSLRESEERLRILIESTPAGVAMFDRDLRYLACSRRWLADYHLEGRDIIGKSHYEVFPEVPERWKEIHRRCLAGASERCDEDRFERADGRVEFLRWEIRPWKDAAGAIGGLVFFTETITERKRAEQSLLESEERLRLALRATNQGLFDLNVQTGEATVTAEYARMLGYEPAEFRESVAAWTQRLHPDEREAAAGLFRDYIEGRLPEYRVEFRQRTKSGEWRWILSLGKLVAWDGEGRPLRMLGTHTDISAAKQAEQERERLQAQLLHSQKMESVGRLAGGVAHDFNNMLVVILGHAELAMAGVDAGTPVYEHMRRVYEAGQRSADLTSQLLTYARKQPINPKVLDLNNTVTSMLRMLRRIIGENIEIAWKPAPHACLVRMDPTQIDQILANLAINARDAIGGAGGGKLVISTENVAAGEIPPAREHADPDECLTEPGPGEYVRLMVTDNGCGMDRATLDHLFEPFFTTKELGKGTGLGCAMVYGIVKQNNGRIHVASSPGDGTTFSIYLPRMYAVEHPGPASPEVRPAHGTETVLLVEDEGAILNLARVTLEKRGYKVLCAHSPAAAMELASRHDGRIDLLLTDVVMHGGNGRELRDRLLAARPEIKVLFMSGYTADVIWRDAPRGEQSNFLQKPFSLAGLASKVREVLDG